MPFIKKYQKCSELIFKFIYLDVVDPLIPALWKSKLVLLCFPFSTWLLIYYYN